MSGGSNLGPTSKKLIERINLEANKLRYENSKISIPSDLVTESGSGLDPHISFQGALIQIPRISRVRGLSESKILEIVKKNLEPRQFFIFGEPRINVLNLNLELDKTPF